MQPVHEGELSYYQQLTFLLRSCNLKGYRLASVLGIHSLLFGLAMGVCINTITVAVILVSVVSHLWALSAGISKCHHGGGLGWGIGSPLHLTQSPRFKITSILYQSAGSARRHSAVAAWIRAADSGGHACRPIAALCNGWTLGGGRLRGWAGEFPSKLTLPMCDRL